MSESNHNSGPQWSETEDHTSILIQIEVNGFGPTRPIRPKLLEELRRRGLLPPEAEDQPESETEED